LITSVVAPQAAPVATSMRSPASARIAVRHRMPEGDHHAGEGQHRATAAIEAIAGNEPARAGSRRRMAQCR
jgi:hypothetical protein